MRFDRTLDHAPTLVRRSWGGAVGGEIWEKLFPFRFLFFPFSFHFLSCFRKKRELSFPLFSRPTGTSPARNNPRDTAHIQSRVVSRPCNPPAALFDDESPHDSMGIR